MIKRFKQDQNTFRPSRVEAAELEISDFHSGKSYFVNKRRIAENFKTIKQVFALLLEGEEDSRFKAFGTKIYKGEDSWWLLNGKKKPLFM